MEEWKEQLVKQYNLEELVPDNVFLYKFKMMSFQESELELISIMGVYYQILSIEILSNADLGALNKPRMLIVVAKK